ncbi:uncharacterized protein PGTG_20358 [Puccinia graminis f. sp. tritici CRL 75-36-700-3]|uniref:Uncharacterized protein n=1 Tax=Puccinia graminis f. sp. tritici (strain CRL 75-36-700-3 / race SCCL) TaxID=418459 RepID=E3NXV3_PUCGT|nr:uncharacterized protein PGTG_20358 [Puccinia graminis f. sp. tritici CRL 75-36-700-3]EFP94402.1 hypothetical protein PGTG_20358 [Puccinia graminis f. sp. tritici CRL 75-36-700-3]
MVRRTFRIMKCKSGWSLSTGVRKGLTSYILAPLTPALTSAVRPPKEALATKPQADMPGAAYLLRTTQDEERASRGNLYQKHSAKQSSTTRPLSIDKEEEEEKKVTDVLLEDPGNPHKCG